LDTHSVAGGLSAAEASHVMAIVCVGAPGRLLMSLEGGDADPCGHNRGATDDGQSIIEQGIGASGYGCSRSERAEKRRLLRRQG